MFPPLSTATMRSATSAALPKVIQRRRQGRRPLGSPGQIRSRCQHHPHRRQNLFLRSPSQSRPRTRKICAKFRTPPTRVRSPSQIVRVRLRRRPLHQRPGVERLLRIRRQLRLRAPHLHPRAPYPSICRRQLHRRCHPAQQPATRHRRHHHNAALAARHPGRRRSAPESKSCPELAEGTPAFNSSLPFGLFCRPLSTCVPAHSQPLRSAAPQSPAHTSPDRLADRRIVIRRNHSVPTCAAASSSSFSFRSELAGRPTSTISPPPAPSSPQCFHQPGHCPASRSRPSPPAPAPPYATPCAWLPLE